MVNNSVPPVDSFINRSISLSEEEITKMLKTIGIESIDRLIKQTVPNNIAFKGKLDLPIAQSESIYLKHISDIGQQNKLFKTYIGLGYYYCNIPSVILRNIFENPGWYTAYTPYQAEISQGRLEALFNFQTMISSLSGLPIANASLLDEATAAAEAMLMQFRVRKNKEASTYLIVDDIFPQTLEVVKNRAQNLNINIITCNFKDAADKIDDTIFGVLLQFPMASGNILDYSNLSSKINSINATLAISADLLSLCLFKSPAEMGAHIAVGSTQRFGLPVGYGGPHAAYFATTEEFKRNIPGRIIGLSIDKDENKAYRMALQTREQHIKREKATSNICTSQALLAIMSGMYAVYHGPNRLKQIATNINTLSNILNTILNQLGFKQKNEIFFDTIRIIEIENLNNLKNIALKHNVNFYYPNSTEVQISIDETCSLYDIKNIVQIFALSKGLNLDNATLDNLINDVSKSIKTKIKFLKRESNILEQDVFNKYHSEHEMLRYIKSLEEKDISLTRSMISLGSCTMKLNPTTSLIPLSSPEFANIHPFVPEDQALGYKHIINELESYLCEITGLDSGSMQPNSGANGEYTGLLVIKKYFDNKGQTNRNIIIIPASAHGTNPASASMAGFDIIVIKCTKDGSIDIEDLKEKINEKGDNIAAIMITYPSTHGVFEDNIKDITDLVHSCGGQVYIDGANMNAQVGLVKIADIGGDVCHLNLHKTFAIPHGGGGPGMGPIFVAKHLRDFLPSHPIVNTNSNSQAILPTSASPFGSASILLISYAYIRLMGPEGLQKASKIAILNANYIKSTLEKSYRILYSGTHGFCAHEFILDCNEFKAYGVEVVDIAKRLIDFGFHAPTVSFPVAGTLMIEPTESESKAELDKFCEALLHIRKEIDYIIKNKIPADNNILKNAPYTASNICSDTWKYSFSRTDAAYPLYWIRARKFFAPVSRINEAYGDRNLTCTC